MALILDFINLLLIIYIVGCLTKTKYFKIEIDLRNNNEIEEKRKENE